MEIDDGNVQPNSLEFIKVETDDTFVGDVEKELVSWSNLVQEIVRSVERRGFK